MATFYTGVDKERYDAGNKFLPMDQFLLNYTAPKTNVEEVTTSYGIPSTNAFTYSGGDQNYYPGKTSNLIGDFNRDIQAYNERINEANRPLRKAQFPSFPQAKTPGGNKYVNAMYNMATKDINDAFNRSGMSSTFPTRTAKEIQDYANEALLSHQEKARTGQFGPSYIEGEKPTLKRRLNDFAYDHIPGINRSQSYEDIMEKGYRETGGVMPGIMGLMNKFGIQNFANLSQADQAFITSQKGYTGPTVFGEIGSNMGHSRDIFGKNVESLFGNYAEGVQKDYDKLSEHFGSKTLEKHGGTWDEEKGMFVGPKADYLNKMNKLNITRFNFRKNQMNEQKNIEADLAARHQKERDFASGDVDTSQQAAADQARQDRAYREETGGEAGSYAPGGGSGEHAADASGSTYSDPFDPGGGEKDGGFIDGSNRRVPFFYGGLASVLGRKGFADGGLDWDEGGDTPMPGGGHGSGHEDAVAAMGGDNQNNTVVVPKTNYIDVKPDLVREDPYVDFSVMSPLEKLKLQATIGYRDIFDNDDLYAKGDLTTNLIPGVTTNTQVTDDGIGNTTLNLGNFSTTFDPNKNLKNIGYNNSYNGINYGVNYGDGNTMFNVGTTFKNGGLARLL